MNTSISEYIYGIDDIHEQSDSGDAQNEHIVVEPVTVSEMDVEATSDSTLLQEGHHQPIPPSYTHVNGLVGEAEVVHGESRSGTLHRLI